MSYGERLLPPKGRRKPKQVKVRVDVQQQISEAEFFGEFGVHAYRQPILTYHIYGKRPKRGTVVRISGGLYAGHLGKVVRRHSWRYRGYTYLANVVRPTQWSN